MKREYNDAKKQANQRWDAANLKRLSVAMSISDYAKMREHISETNESQNGFINRAIKETISNDNWGENE